MLGVRVSLNFFHLIFIFIILSVNSKIRVYFNRCVGQKNSGGWRNFAIFEPVTVICTHGGHRACLIWRTSTGKLSMTIEPVTSGLKGLVTCGRPARLNNLRATLQLDLITNYPILLVLVAVLECDAANQTGIKPKSTIQ